MTADVVDQARRAQPRCRLGHTLSAHAEHVAEGLLRHGQMVVRQTIHGQEQPAAELLIDGMMAVAYRRLGDLRDQCLREAQHQVVKLIVAVELRLHLGYR
jgi:hypothetical protein